MQHPPQTLDVRVRSPFAAMVAGRTGSGKTRLVMRLIRKAKDVANPPPVEIIYCYGVWQEGFHQIAEHVTFHEGLLDVRNDIPADGRNRWLVIDDLMQEASGNGDTDNIYTKFSHHKNVSVFFIVQNLFGKNLRTISLNTHYFFLFKNPRASTTVSSLASQAFSGSVPVVMEAYRDATSSPNSFLMMDLTQETDEACRLIGNYASDKDDMVVYVPKRV